MIKGDYDYLTNLAKFNVCAEHHTPLEVAWYGEEKAWVLRCGQNHYPDTITRNPSLTELYRQGEELPSYIEDNIKKADRRREMSEGKQSTAVTMGGISAVDLGTGELLVPETVKALVEYARKYELDPARGHVVLMYGEPYIGLDGYLYKANRSKKPYSLTGRPLTTEELKLRGYKENDLGHISRVRFLDTGQEFEGEGFITTEEIEATVKGKEYQKRYPVVANKPGNMVVKRADWQALRRAFPIGESEQKGVKGETED